MRNAQMKNNQSGFTLIELVVVIVILGILAVTALPKFVDLSGDARTAATQGVAGALGSASSINYSASLARGAVNNALFASTATTTAEDTINGCTNDVATSLMQAGATFAASGAGTYSITGGSLAAQRVGSQATCTITNNDNGTSTATFLLLGAQ